MSHRPATLFPHGYTVTGTLYREMFWMLEMRSRPDVGFPWSEWIRMKATDGILWEKQTDPVNERSPLALLVWEPWSACAHVACGSKMDTCRWTGTPPPWPRRTKRQ